jgi:hypothetical protein
MKPLIVFAIAALAASCAKDADNKPATASPGEAAPGAAAEPGKTGAPEVAIGANKVKHFEAPKDARTLADTSEFTLALEAPDAVATGASGVFKVNVIPKEGWKLNEEFETRLKVSPPEGVSIEKPNQGKGDAESWSPKGARWAVGFTPSSAGAKSFTGKVRFAVCTETTCNPRQHELAFAVDVK